MLKDALHNAFILHTRPYRDTSLIAELFTVDEGRLSVMARGVRSARTKQKSLLQPFTPILVAYAGRGELLSLRRLEPTGNAFNLPAQALFSGFYLNELLMRLLHRHEPHPNLFQAYLSTLKRLQMSVGQVIAIEQALRNFELILLHELGYGLALQKEATGVAILASQYYQFIPEQGLQVTDVNNNASGLFSGASILALHQDQLIEKEHLLAAKRLLRMALAPLLGNKPLKSRELF
jgi:DNA repair protein RecO (recombination protein O)